jgi:hypothetical protein
MEQHLDSIHGGKKSHKQSIYDYTSSDKGHLKQHIESVHEGKQP